MPAIVPTSDLMTLDQMLALPADGRVDRELIRGRLRETPDLPRDRHHGAAMARTGRVLCDWLEAQPVSLGEVVSRAGFRLSRQPDTLVGIDLAIVPAEVVASEPELPWFEGFPSLAVEVLSWDETSRDIDDKVELYLETGVAVVWVINPRFRTVTVYRPDAEPELFNVLGELTAEPHLPGFRVAVASLFPA